MKKEVKKKEVFTKDDCKIIVTMIEAMSKRGGLLGGELTTAGYLYDKTVKILNTK